MPHMPRKYARVLVAAITVLVVWAIVLRDGKTRAVKSYHALYFGDSAHSSAAKGYLELSPILKKFLSDIRGVHPSQGSGNIAPLVNHDRKMSDDMHLLQDINSPVNKRLLQHYLQIDEASTEKLKGQHRSVVRAIPQAPTNYLEGRGIVLTGGGDLFGQSLIAIRYLVERYPGFPIELWMSVDEYEPKYCDEIFPSQNVSCMVVEDFYGSKIRGFDYMGYPLKALALAGSRFAEVFFMDVDCFPTASLERVFDSSPYKDTGYISWPDYWMRVTAPQYYEVAGLRMPESEWTELKDIPRAVPYSISSETGQMFIDKRRHWNTLLLALYYNLNGENYYYPLLSQGSAVPGFGDKETFISAAYVLGNEVYQVKSEVGTLGFFSAPGEYHGSAIVQRDPIKDYEGANKTEIAPFSLHANNMKLDPYFIFGEEPKDFRRPNQHLSPERSLGYRENVIDVFNFDIELHLYEIAAKVVCEWLQNFKPRRGRDVDMHECCSRAQNHVAWMKKNPRPN